MLNLTFTLRIVFIKYCIRDQQQIKDNDNEKKEGDNGTEKTTKSHDTKIILS